MIHSGFNLRPASCGLRVARRRHQCQATCFMVPLVSMAARAACHDGTGAQFAVRLTDRRASKRRDCEREAEREREQESEGGNEFEFWAA